MADYISREAAIKAILDLHDCYNGFSDTYDKACIVGTLEEVPAADVVEIKKDPCKDCQEFDCQECKYRERGRLYGRRLYGR